MNHSIDFCWMPSPLGDMLLVGTPEALTGIYFVDQKYRPEIDPRWNESGSKPVLSLARRQLEQYFAGRREQFELPLDPQGTPFQRAIWKAIANVRWGAIATYADLAERIGRAGCARAAGAATGRNPLSIVVPCHRIVGSSGALTGYAGGLDRKRALLALERGEICELRTAA